jgi:hypothetical protein
MYQDKERKHRKRSLSLTDFECVDRVAHFPIVARALANARNAFDMMKVSPTFHLAIYVSR